MALNQQETNLRDFLEGLAKVTNTTIKFNDTRKKTAFTLFGEDGNSMVIGFPYERDDPRYLSDLAHEIGHMLDWRYSKDSDAGFRPPNPNQADYNKEYAKNELNAESWTKALFEQAGLPVPFGAGVSSEEYMKGWEQYLTPEEAAKEKEWGKTVGTQAGKLFEETFGKEAGQQAGDERRNSFWNELGNFAKTPFAGFLPFNWANNFFRLNRDGFANFRIGYSDPLSLDLDGDGIETIGHNGTGGAMFDFDADGIKNPTGWLKPDDGLLVFDRNNDGIINNGTELFGDSTLLSNGNTAEHGFAALADLDSNKDGVIDAKDTAFSKLKVWRDLNGDGISQANELFTLNELGIASLNLEYKNVNVGLAGNNQLAQIGSYTRTDGTTGQMGDVNFNFDPLANGFIDPIELTPEQQAAANVTGMGRLRDLREAAALSPDLAAKLEAYTNAKTKEAQLALLPELLEAWARTDPKFNSDYDKINFGAAEHDPNSSNQASGSTSGNGMILISNELKERWKDAALLTAILDSFTNITTERLAYISAADAERICNVIETTFAGLFQANYDALLLQTRLKPYVDAISLTIKDNKFSLDFAPVLVKFEEAYAKDAKNAFIDLGEFIASQQKDHVWVEGIALFSHYIDLAKAQGVFADYQAALGQHALSKTGYLFGSVGNETLIGGNGNNILEGGAGNDTLFGNAGDDTYIFNQGDGQDIIRDMQGNNAIIFKDLKFTDAKFIQNGVHLIIQGTGNDTVTIEYFFTDSRYQMKTYQFADQTLTLNQLMQQGLPLSGTEQNSTITGWKGNNLIYGGSGNEKIVTYEGNDHILGGAGNDTIDSGAGDDILEGGTGNDLLLGGAGNDTYIFNQGDGQDIIRDQQGNNTIVFKDLNLADAKFVQNGVHLVIQGMGDDSVTIEYFFVDSRYQIKTYQFADQTLTLVQLMQQGLPLSGTEQNSTITGWNGNNLIYGGSGNEKIVTYEGNDRILGGAGNDTIDSGAGDDVLEGGEGNDLLLGGAGNDTYIFNQGDGQDIIRDQQGNNTIVFRDLKLADAKFIQNGVHLIIQGAGNDSVTIEYFFSNSSYQMKTYQFADQTLTLDQLMQQGLPLSGTEQNSIINGWGQSQQVYGGSGNETINTGSGNDILSGGAGDDTLNGGAGNDTYLFGNNHGKDVVKDSAGNDVIMFTGEQQAENLWFSREGNNLLIETLGTTDSITVNGWFSNANFQIETIQLSSGQALINQQVQSLINAMASFAPAAGSSIDVTTQKQDYLAQIGISSYWDK